MEDPPNFDVYLHIQPGEKAKMQLPVYVLRRPESGLEKFHEQLAHYGNTGMSTGLVDVLTIGGTTVYNVGVRHRHHVAAGLLPMQFTKIPKHFDDIPLFMNHHLLGHLNELSQKKGLPIIFSNCDRFLSDYL